MPNLTNPKLIWIKGILFLALGLLASSLLIARHPELASAALLAIAIWAFCRAYLKKGTFYFFTSQKVECPLFQERELKVG